MVDGIVSGTITITGATPTNNVTVKAVAIDVFDTLSGVTTGTFFNDYNPTAPPVIPDPLIALPSGTYTNVAPPNPLATLVTASAPATRTRYTIDGSTPSATVGNLVNQLQWYGTFPQNTTTTFKVIAIDAGTNVSNVVTRNYTVAWVNNIPLPTITPPSGTYNTFPGVMSFRMQTTAPATGLIYSLDGSTPTIGAIGGGGTFQSGTQLFFDWYVPQGTTTTVKCRSRDAYGNLSGTVTSVFTNIYVAPPPIVPANPTLTPASGRPPINVTIRCVAPAVKMMFTIDESTPTLTHGNLVNGTSFFTTMPHSGHMQAIAITSANVASGIAVGHYS